MNELDPRVKRVQAFYDASPETEWQRLDQHPIEFALTRRILSEYLPPAPSAILDLGGGPGRYALELARQGYQVTLADLSPANIAFAERKSKELCLALSGFLVQDASQPLPFPVNTFDAVLLLGPLYHLITFEQRLTAVRNALDVLKPGGMLFAAFITLSGALRSIVMNSPNQLASEWRTMHDGTNDPDLGFTEAYFARIPEIEVLMKTAGCQLVEIIGCEGFSAIVEQSFLSAEIDKHTWQHWVELNLEFGRHTTALEASDHILYVARKP
ncbi:MAG: class I SAM-dependent methyltransferase [Anaerolineae bacterium]|jgi:SAM-dependent methyltransferase|nr:class I SAM-dependent methyltransferase [Anaerolineae bacterium]